MKRFTSIHDVTEADVLQILDAWEMGAMNAADVHDWAEGIFDSPETFAEYPFSHKDPKSIIFAVLDDLQKMYSFPMSKLDIPHLRQVLMLSAVNLEEAWREYDDYWSKVDFGERRRNMAACLRLMPERYRGIIDWYDDPITLPPDLLEDQEER